MSRSICFRRSVGLPAIALCCVAFARASAALAGSGLAAIDAFHVGRYHLAEGRCAEALDSFNDAVRMNPQFVQAYLARGKLLAEMGEYDSALADLNFALHLQPTHAEGFAYRGYALLSLARADEALREFDAALRLDPTYARVHFLRSRALSALGDEAGAAAAKTAALNLDPSIGNVQVVAAVDDAGMVDQAVQFAGPASLDRTSNMMNTAVPPSTTDSRDLGRVVRFAEHPELSRLGRPAIARELRSPKPAGAVQQQRPAVVLAHSKAVAPQPSTQAPPQAQPAAAAAVPKTGHPTPSEAEDPTKPQAKTTAATEILAGPLDGRYIARPSQQESSRRFEAALEAVKTEVPEMGAAPVKIDVALAPSALPVFIDDGDTFAAPPPPPTMPSAVPSTMITDEFDAEPIATSPNDELSAVADPPQVPIAAKSESPTADLAATPAAAEPIAPPVVELPAAQESTDAELASVAFACGLEFEQAGNLDAALREYDHVLWLTPDDAQAYCRRGHLHLDAAHPTEALSDFDSAVRCAPGLANGYFGRGHARYLAHEYAEAIDDFTIALRLDDQHARALVERGHCNFLLGKTSDAESDRRAAWALDPSLAQCGPQYGGEVVQVASTPSPVPDVSTAGFAFFDDESEVASAAAAVPQNSAATTPPADEVASADDTATAAAAASTAPPVSTAPSKVEVCCENARKLIEAGHLTEALDELDRAVRCDEKCALAYRLRGDVLRRCGNVQAAEADARRAAELETSAR